MTEVHSHTAAALLAAARQTGQGAPIVVGALGFAPETPPRLVVPRVVHRGRPPRWLPDVPAVDATGQWAVRSRPEPDEFRRGVQRALALIAAGRLEKVVLARSLELDGTVPVPVAALLRRLADRNACGHVFAADITGPGDPTPRTLLGATPELLVSRRGCSVVSNPLAGSARRRPDPVADRASATALIRSDKDRREHAVVIDEVRRALDPYCIDLVGARRAGAAADHSDVAPVHQDHRHWFCPRDVTAVVRRPGPHPVRRGVGVRGI